MENKSTSLKKWGLVIAFLSGFFHHISVTKAMQYDPSNCNQPTSKQSKLVVMLTNGKKKVICPLPASPCMIIPYQGIAKDQVKSITATGVLSFVFTNFNDYTQLEKLFFPEIKFIGNLHLCNTKLKDLTGFPELSKISYLDLRKQINLTNISGLNKLVQIRQIYLDKNTKLREITGLQSLTKIKTISRDIKDIVQKIIILKPISSHAMPLVCGYIRSFNVYNSYTLHGINQLIISYGRSYAHLIDLVEKIG